MQVATLMGGLSVGGPTQGLEAGVRWMMDDGDHPWAITKEWSPSSIIHLTPDFTQLAVHIILGDPPEG